LNGEPLDLNLKNGFAVVERQWSKGDVVELDLPMPVRRVVAHENVEDDRNRVALTRGPIVYCAEGVDNGGKLFDLVVPDDAEFQAEYKSDLLNGVTVINGKAVNKSGEQRELTAIPYYAWAHRGNGEMAVWLPRKKL
jgi:DUF1680 family protein